MLTTIRSSTATGVTMDDALKSVKSGFIELASEEGFAAPNIEAVTIAYPQEAPKKFDMFFCVSWTVRPTNIVVPGKKNIVLEYKGMIFHKDCKPVEENAYAIVTCLVFPPDHNK